MASVSSTAKLSSSNFMEFLPERMRFYDVVLPGSHDTGSFGFTTRAWNSFSPAVMGATVTGRNLNATTMWQTQEERSDFKTQLEKGIRFWDVRLRKTSDVLGSNLNIFHGTGVVGAYVGTSLSGALSAAQDFLQRNPGETLVISLKREGPFTADATSEINAADIQAYLDKYATNSSLPAGRNGLWVAGPKDFESIKAARELKGLADLNKAGSGFELETRNPRTNPGVKLNYENLTLGDVRGKIVLHMRDFGGYYDWKDAGFAAIDGGGNGGYSTGLYFQDNYEGPTYTQKKADILNHAKGLYVDGDRATQNKRFSWNFTSATTGITGGWPREWLVNPATFALTINAGPTKRGFQTDDSVNPLKPKRSASLKTMLSETGELTKWNLAEKRKGNAGMRGALGGDYMLAPQNWYDDFWNNPFYSRKTRFPNLNDKDYHASDHLTKLIWKQNALAVPVLEGATQDSVTGLPVYREKQFGVLRLQSFLGNADKLGLKAEINRITAEQAGLSAAQIAGIVQTPLTTPVPINYQTSKQASQAGFVNRRSRSKVVTEFDTVRVPFMVQGTPGTDGYSFFRIDLEDPTTKAKIVAPMFFAVTDTL